MMAAREFQLMKKTAFLINIGRGACVVLDDLVAALQAGEIAGAGLDVYEIEPLPPDHPLWTMPGITPHVAGVGPYCKNVAPSYSSKIASVSTRGGRCTTSSTRLTGSERYRLWKSPLSPGILCASG